MVEYQKMILNQQQYLKNECRYKISFVYVYIVLLYNKNNICNIE